MLLAARHRRNGARFGPANTSTGRDRGAGFREQLAEAGVPLPAHRLRHAGFTLRYGEQSLPEVVQGGRGATAVFCANDTIAFGALNAARTSGLRVPHDVAVVGIDDLGSAAWPMLSLSTVHVPFDDMLASAVGLLLERIAGHRGGGRTVSHPVTPVPRSTHTRG